MPLRFQNDSHTTSQPPSYYARNRLYKDSYTRNDYPTRTSRRIHDGLSLPLNYGLDTTSDDVNSSPYSSPYYVNGRYNSANVTTQRGNSASVQGTKRLLTIGDMKDTFTEADVQTTIQMWQGKQIKFEIPYNGKVVGQILSLKNTGACQGILSIYISARKDGPVVSETAIDLCTVSQDNFEMREVYTMTPIDRTANPRGVLYVRMEIWEDLECERSTNPFNTGRKIEIAATGIGNHEEAIVTLGEKNLPVTEKYIYQPKPSRPCMGIIYNNNTSIPVERNEGVDIGARVSSNNYDYDIFAYNDGTSSHMVIYDRNTNTTIPNNLPLDSRTTKISIAQFEDYMYYIDGYSPLQRVKIGDWNNVYQFPTSTTDSVKVTIDETTWLASGITEESGTFIFGYTNERWEYEGKEVALSTYGITLSGTPADGAEIKVTYIAATQTTTTDLQIEYYDTRPVLGASIMLRHNTRLYLGGFLGDPNLMQCSRITAKGADFNSFPYRWYVPSRSPKETSTNPITGIVEYRSDQIMITTTNSDSLYTTNVDLESGIPTQVSTYSDGAGVAASGDICSYRGIIYSFDPDEGLRYYSGALWKPIAGQHIGSLFERVDMTKPRKLWGYAYKLYFNYYDILDGKAKCIIYDMQMNYQQYPFFQDIDCPFCDVRYNDDFDLMGIHPDYPCIMQLYAQDTWSRLDTPIIFERWTKYISLPGNAADMILRRVHMKVIANTNRWWNFGISADDHTLKQMRGNTVTYRLPSWDTLEAEHSPEDIFTTETVFSEKAVDLLTIPNVWNRAVSVQIKTRCKTYRSQANLISIIMESRVRNYN